MDGRRSLMMARRFGSGPLVANVGDIAYKASDGSIKVIAPDLWSASLGTPVGVVVIPSGFAPDNGNARIVSLYYVGGSSAKPSTMSLLYWSKTGGDMSLPNFKYVPTTYNTGSGVNGYAKSGVLPSDEFVGEEKSLIDPEAGYGLYSPFIPSPYLGDTPNPDYYGSILVPDNALSDFNGKGNTDVLATSSSFVAAYEARRYKAEGAEEIEWYLPAMGELGYLWVRFNKIKSALTKCNAGLVYASNCWSSTEYSDLYAYHLNKTNGNVSAQRDKGNTCVVRPFAQLDF